MGDMGIGPRVFDCWLHDEPSTPVKGRDTKLIIVMEQLLGMTFDRYKKMYRHEFDSARKQEFSEKHANLYRLIDERIDQMHAAHVMHRDLYSRNIFLQGKIDALTHEFILAGVKLLDYGLADIVKEMTPTLGYVNSLTSRL